MSKIEAKSQFETKEKFFFEIFSLQFVNLNVKKK